MNSTDSHLTPDELLKAVEQMRLSDLEQFVDKAIALKAHRKAPHLSKDESKLLNRINHWLPLISNHNLMLYLPNVRRSL